MPNRFPIEDSFSESSVGKYDWEGREAGQDWEGREVGPNWERETAHQPWLPVRGIQQPFQQQCGFKFLFVKDLANLHVK